MRRAALVTLLLAAVAACSQPVPLKVQAICDFTYPWADKPAPRTEFRARTAEGRLRFTFLVDDADVIVANQWHGESTLDGEDRVEIFFAKDPTLADYWCVEIDPLGRIHDYHARHYRQFDHRWNCPDLITTGARTAAGYEVTGSIGLGALSQLLGRPIGRGAVLHIGLFRAQFYGPPGPTRGDAADNWISWVGPTTREPDFHVPSAFGDWIVP